MTDNNNASVGNALQRRQFVAVFPHFSYLS